MSFRFCLNMEPLSLQIAEESIALMKESNYSEKLSSIEGFPVADRDAFSQNLSHGFVAITMLCCYYESFLNTVLRDYFLFDPDGSVLRGNEETKLEILFRDEKEALRLIKATSAWRDTHRVLKMRNDLVHYKNNAASEFASLPPIFNWKIGKEIIGSFFIQSEIKKCSLAVQSLVEQIAHALNLETGAASDDIVCDHSWVNGKTANSDETIKTSQQK